MATPLPSVVENVVFPQNKIVFILELPSQRRFEKTVPPWSQNQEVIRNTLEQVHQTRYFCVGSLDCPRNIVESRLGSSHGDLFDVSPR